jgi:hypothetical protein
MLLKGTDMLGSKKFFIALLASLIGLGSNDARGEYNANMSGVVDMVITYTDADRIYFHLTNQPSTHPSCLPGLFVISGSVSEARRKNLLARLLVAKASGESISIGYDNAGDCGDGGYIRVHRVG